MLRKAADPELSARILSALNGLLDKYSAVPPAELEAHLASSDPVERDFWQQINLGHIFDRSFKPETGISYFDIVRKAGVWDFAARAFPESELSESVVANSRRIPDSDLRPSLAK